ncbi:STAS domain-containing protein [Streptomyces uncialis]|uniref:STAS domain-containing protein n=1 Tax=Streptomyces uncialis TaxID=1048205 RepID=UPI0037F7F1F5
MTTPDPTQTPGPGDQSDPATVTEVYGATFTRTTRLGHQVIAVDGQLHEYSAPLLRDFLDEAVATGGQGDIVLDLTLTGLIESTAMGVLIRAHKSSTSRQVFRIVTADGTQPCRVLEKTGLSRVIPVHLSLDDALRAARARPPEPGSGTPDDPQTWQAALDELRTALRAAGADPLEPSAPARTSAAPAELSVVLMPWNAAAALAQSGLPGGLRSPDSLRTALADRGITATVETSRNPAAALMITPATPCDARRFAALVTGGLTGAQAAAQRLRTAAARAGADLPALHVPADWPGVVDPGPVPPTAAAALLTALTGTTVPAPEDRAEAVRLAAELRNAVQDTVRELRPTPDPTHPGAGHIVLGPLTPGQADALAARLDPGPTLRSDTP